MSEPGRRWSGLQMAKYRSKERQRIVSTLAYEDLKKKYVLKRDRERTREREGERRERAL